MHINKKNLLFPNGKFQWIKEGVLKIYLLWFGPCNTCTRLVTMLRFSYITTPPHPPPHPPPRHVINKAAPPRTVFSVPYANLLIKYHYKYDNWMRKQFCMSNVNGCHVDADSPLIGRRKYSDTFTCSSCIKRSRSPFRSSNPAVLL